MGLYIDGTLMGVEFVVSGKLQDGTPYGASVKLKFHEQLVVKKMIDGSSVDMNTTRTTVVGVACTDAELMVLKNKYDSKIGKELKLELEPADNSKFKLLSDFSDAKSTSSKASS
jgi:hypothetical protein